MTKANEVDKKYRCPICKMKKKKSPLIHGFALMKRYSKHGLKLHIVNHRKNYDDDLVKKWERENGDIESCRID